MVEPTAEKTIQTAYLALRENEFDTVLAILDPLWRSGASDPEVPKIMGIARLKRGESAESVKLLEHANDLSNGNEGEILYYLSCAAFAEKDAEKAVSAALGCVAKLPNVGEAHGQLFNAISISSTDDFSSLLARWQESFVPGDSLTTAVERLADILGGAEQGKEILRLASSLLICAGLAEEAVCAFTRSCFSFGGRPPPRFNENDMLDKFAALAEAYDANDWSVMAAKQFTDFVLEHIGVADGLRILDAGCGTGLLGDELRLLAARLDGIDLSAGMLERARQRGIYHSLAEGDLVETMSRPDRRARYDLIVCNWCLFYFPDLEGFFAAATSALAPGGRVLFTVYACGDEADVVGKEKTVMEYAHSRRYLRRLAAGNGFGEERLEVRQLCVYPGIYGNFFKR